MSHISRRLTVVFLGGLALSACSRNYSTAVDESTGRQRIYALADENAMRIAHNAIIRSFPGRRVEAIDGPVRGYSTYTRVMLDTFTQQVVVQPVTGITADGRTVEGYVFEVSGNGTSGTGALQNTAFFNTLKSDLERTGTGADVVSTQIRQVPSPPARTEPGASDPIEQLRRLRELYQQGAITAPEYEQKRAELLKRI